MGSSASKDEENETEKNQSQVQNQGNVKENAMMKVQMAKEISLVIRDDSCIKNLANTMGVDPNTLNSGEELLSRLNEFIVKNKLEKQYYDPILMGIISCLLKVGLVADEYFSADPFMKTILTRPQHLGKPRIEGIAMLVGLKSIDNIFVVKTPRKAEDDTLIHEYFVANGASYLDDDNNAVVVRGTNYLRKFCLNYSQVLGAFRCLPPTIQAGNRRVGPWCKSDLTEKDSFINYLIYEKIPGIDVKEYCKIMNMHNFLSIVIQLCMALDIGNMINGFTHYDLHYENVILRPASPVPEPAYIPFFYGGKTIYVLGKYVATMIDFGRSHVQNKPPGDENSMVDIDHYGFRATYALKYGVHYYESRPLYDIFKFLGFTLHELYKAKNPIFNQAWLLMRFFGFRDSRTTVAYLEASREGDLFSLSSVGKGSICLGDPDQENAVCMKEDEAGIPDFLEYLKQQFPRKYNEIVSENINDPNLTVLKCGQECLDPRSTLESITYVESPGNVRDLTNLHFNRASPQGIFDLLVFRENMSQRYYHFLLSQEMVGDYVNQLKTSLDYLDKSFSAKDFKLMEEYLSTKIKSALTAYEKMKETNLSPPKGKMFFQDDREKLMVYNNYLHKSTFFASAHADAFEALEYFSILSKIVYFGNETVSNQAKEFFYSSLTKPLSEYRNTVTLIRQNMDAMKVSADLLYLYQNIYLQTI